LSERELELMRGEKRLIFIVLYIS